MTVSSAYMYSNFTLSLLTSSPDIFNSSELDLVLASASSVMLSSVSCHVFLFNAIDTLRIEGQILSLLRNRKTNVRFIDIVVPNDEGVGNKEQEKIEKYLELRQEIATFWGMKKVEVIPVVTGALDMIQKRLEMWVRKIGVNIRTETLQKSALLGTARIL